MARVRIRGESESKERGSHGEEREGKLGSNC